MMSLEERQNNERLEQEAAIFNVKLKMSNCSFYNFKQWDYVEKFIQGSILQTFSSEES